MGWTPVGFGRRNGNGPTGSQFIIHGGIELELFVANTLACFGAYLVSIQVGFLLEKPTFTTGCALVWRDRKGKKRPQIFTQCRVVFSVASCPWELF